METPEQMRDAMAAGRDATTKPIVFVLGDSISMHYGQHLAKLIAGRFRYARKTGREKALRHAKLEHDGNGGHSGKVLDYLRAMAADRSWRVDVLLMNCGLHDTKIIPPRATHQVPIERYRRNVTEAIRLAKRLAGQVIWVRSTHVNEAAHPKRFRAFRRHNAAVSAYNLAADAIAAASGVRILDLDGFTRGLRAVLSEPLYADHVHFSPHVCRLQAAFIAGGLAAMVTR